MNLTNTSAANFVMDELALYQGTVSQSSINADFSFSHANPGNLNYKNISIIFWLNSKLNLRISDSLLAIQ